MTTQQMVRARDLKRSTLETHYRTIGISAVVAAVEGRKATVSEKKSSHEDLKFAERFSTTDSD